MNVRQLRAATKSDRTLSKVFRYTQSGWPHQIPQKLKPFADRRNELTVEEGCLLWGYRVLIPRKLRPKLLQELHRDHPGVVRMKAIARSYMWWPGTRPGNRTNGQRLSTLPSREASSSQISSPSLGMARQAVATRPSGFCGALPGIDVLGRRRCVFKVA